MSEQILTPEDLAAIRQRCEAATPGPWVQWNDNPSVYLGPVSENTGAWITGSRGRIADLELEVNDDDGLPAVLGANATGWDLEDEETVEGLLEDQALRNAAFVAEARSDLPRALATIEALQDSADLRRDMLLAVLRMQDCKPESPGAVERWENSWVHLLDDIKREVAE